MQLEGKKSLQEKGKKQIIFCRREIIYPEWHS
jgi:hypothetical protein